jgi:uncharacterized protein YcfJ
MNLTPRSTLKATLVAAGLALATQAAAQVTFYERDGFHGRSMRTEHEIVNMQRTGFNDRASSAVVESGSWQVCEDAGFNGHCVLLRPGSYPDLHAVGLNDRISSVREIGGYVPSGDYRRRSHERLYEAPVTSVHAVVGPPEQRCWVEREQVASEGHGGANVPGAIAGAVIGGILGHQIGSGRGNDVATAGGAVAGAAIGANVGRGPGVEERDVRRCRTVPGSAHPDYWDVTYTFRGITHHIQTSAPPGPTIAVNGQGEPRV